MHFRSDEKLWLEGSNLFFLLQILTEYTSTCRQGRFNNKKLTLVPILEYHASELGFLTLPPMSQKNRQNGIKISKNHDLRLVRPLKAAGLPSNSQDMDYPRVTSIANVSASSDKCLLYFFEILSSPPSYFPSKLTSF